MPTASHGDHVEIRVLGGFVAFVSACDAEAINQLSWSVQHRKSCGVSYAKASVWRNGRSHTVLMHRLIFGLAAGDKHQVDHINSNGLDNRRENLRVATAVQNGGNRRRVKNQTGFKGVSKKNGGFRTIMAGKYIGAASTAAEAAAMYDKAALAKWGEFAATNKLLGLLP